MSQVRLLHLCQSISSVVVLGGLVSLVGAIGIVTGVPQQVAAQTNPAPSATQSAQLEEAKRLNQQAGRLYKQGQYAAAIPLAQRALAIFEKALGPEHPLVAASLNNLAGLYREQGNYTKAEPLYQRALAIREKAQEPEHPDVANSLNHLALLYYYQGNYTKAEPLFQRALAIWEKALGPKHPNVAQSLNNLALLYSDQGNYTKAEPLHQRALAIREKALEPEHPDIAQSLNNLALLYYRQGNYVKAEPLYQRALAIREKALGPEHPDVATSLNNLAGLYKDRGNYVKAEPLYQRALAIREKALGPEHPDVAKSLNNLAGLYREQGNYAKAAPLFQRTLAIWEKALGPEHPNVAISLNNLAVLYREQGNYAKAEPLFQRTLTILEKALGPKHPDVATSLNNLAGLYQEQGNYTKAEPLFQRALAIREKALGPEHPDVATSLNNLALLYKDRGNYVKAEPLFQRALAIREKALDPEHPGVATSLNNLAGLYQEQGNYAKAVPLYQRALAIFEKALGPEHPDVAASLNNLAGLYWAQGDFARAFELLTRGINIEEQNLVLTLTTGSETDKRAYMATLVGTTSATISHHIQGASDNPEATRLALTTVLRRKGRVLDALTDSLQTLHQQLSPKDKALLDQLMSTRSQQATLTYNRPEKLSLDQYRQQLASLAADAQKQEAELSARSAEFRTQSQPITLKAVQQKIPSDAALVELALYHPFNAKGTKLNKKWGAPHYVAYVLHHQGEPKWVDLGEAEPIDKAVASFSQVLQNPGTQAQAKQIARALDAKLMQPIRPLLGNSRSVLLSPDSQLNLIPFAALVDEQNRYLVEHYSISYLSSGRDLMRLQNPSKSRSRPVVIANPDYSQPGDPASVQALASRGSNKRRSIDLAQIQFEPLPGTAQEAQAIAPLLPGVKPLTGSQATENALKQVQGPRILHIATHGFFLKDLPPAPPARTDALTAGPAAPRAELPENPLLRSGLALAGFNQRKSGSEDGVVTALEVAGLDLRGTQLVVLSACETGLGKVEDGEGVYGLRRALVMAGAESQLISLWKVSDMATKDLMVDYYQRLVSGGRSEALRQTHLEMLKTPNYQHPYYWAAFIPSGNWSAMEAKGSK